MFRYNCDETCRSSRCPAALERIAAGWRNGRDIAPGVRGPQNAARLPEAMKLRDGRVPQGRPSLPPAITAVAATGKARDPNTFWLVFRAEIDYTARCILEDTLDQLRLLKEEINNDLDAIMNKPLEW